MHRTLLNFVWSHSWRHQLVIVLASLVSFPLILASLYIPKLIVNDALTGSDFPRQLAGVSLGQVDYLIALCGALLTLIVLNNGVKYLINILKGLTGERLLRRIRFTVFDRVTRFPMARLRNTSSGEVVQIVAAEVEPIGGFAGEMVATPVYQGGQLMVYLGFILAQDLVLGMAAIILFPVQAYVVPKIQRIIVGLVQKRIRNVRAMTSEISEVIDGIETLRSGTARNWHLARMSERLYTNYRLRYQIFLLKFAIKFANNVINHITPFMFYSFGGYQVIQGEMDLGALVAILAAYKDIAAPWKQLLTYYQSFSDISARYDAVYEIYGRERLDTDPEPVDIAGKEIRLRDLRSDLPLDSGGIRGVGFDMAPGSTTLLLGPEEEGRAALVRLVSGRDLPAGGTVTIGGTEGRDLLVRAQRSIALVGRNPHILSGSFRENVAYDVLAEHGSGAPDADQARREREAELTGTIAESPHLDWVDYARLGLPDAAAFDRHVIEVMGIVGLVGDVFERGLQARIETDEMPGLRAAALDARGLIARTARETGLDELVEFWDRDRYLENASLLENLFFARPDHGRRPLPDLVRSKTFCRLLDRAGILGEVLAIGADAAKVIVEILGPLGADSRLMDQFELIDQSEVEPLSHALAAYRRRGPRRLSVHDRALLMLLALQIVPIRHRLGVMDDPARRARIVAARPALARALPSGSELTPLDSPDYVPGLSLVENILGGRPRQDRRDAKVPVRAVLEDLLRGHDIYELVLAAGLRSEVGYEGARLTGRQRRRLALARAIVARPELLVLDGVADGTDDDNHRLRQAIRAALPGATLVMASLNAELVAELAPAGAQVLRVRSGHVLPDAARTAPAA